MEIVDRYLKTLRSALPTAQRDDIIKEFSEDIHSEIEDQEAELGRTLSEAEVEAILKQHGHPLVVAARYRQDRRSLAFGRQLIGPTLFPFYAKVLSFNLGITCVVILIIFTALVASGQTIGFREALSTFFFQLVIQFSIVTLIFSVMDRHLTRFPDRWDPRKPNRAHYPELSAPPQGPAVSRMESISQLIALSIFIVWLRAVRTSPILIFGPGAAFIKAAPIWRQFYLPVVLLTLMNMLQSAINLFRPDWVRLRSFARLAGNTVGLVIFIFLIKAGNWVTLAGNVSSPHYDYEHAIAVINETIFFSLCIGAIFIAVLLLRDLRLLFIVPTARPPKSVAEL
jgi:hypothetical protein